MKSLVILSALAAAFPLAAQAAPAPGSEHAGHASPIPVPAKAPTDHTGHAGHGSGEHKDGCCCCKDKQVKGAAKPVAPAQPDGAAHDHH